MQAVADQSKAAEVNLTIEEVVVRPLDDLKITLERFYTENQAFELTSGFATPIQFEDVNTITIEGWVLELSDSSPEFVSAQNIYGHPDSCITLAQSFLSFREDLPSNGKYFSLTIPVAALLLKNQVRIQIFTKAKPDDAAFVNISCTAPASRSITRYLSIITSGRSGSTLLAKALNTAKDVISLSTEHKEELILRSILMSLLNGVTTAPISRTNFTGQPETYLEPPFDSSLNPLQSFLSISNLEQLFELSWNSAVVHYSKLLQLRQLSKNAIIVEKNWGSPLLPLISQRLGILNVVLLRHPVDIANSMIVYHSKSGYAVPFDAGYDDSLVEYMDQICQSLDWLAKYLPNALILKYEDLVLDLPRNVSFILKRLCLSQDTANGFQIEAEDWNRVRQTTTMHKSSEFMLTEILAERLRSKCSTFIKTYYSGA